MSAALSRKKPITLDPQVQAVALLALASCLCQDAAAAADARGDWGEGGGWTFRAHILAFWRQASGLPANLRDGKAGEP